jgi:hypothetical protein
VGSNSLSARATFKIKHVVATEPEKYPAYVQHTYCKERDKRVKIQIRTAVCTNKSRAYLNTCNNFPCLQT